MKEGVRCISTGKNYVNILCPRKGSKTWGPGYPPGWHATRSAGSLLRVFILL